MTRGLVWVTLAAATAGSGALGQGATAGLPAAPEVRMAARGRTSGSTSGLASGLSPGMSPGMSQISTLSGPPLAKRAITRGEAEAEALRNNPRITASRLLALAAGQVTRETRAGELPQVNSAVTAEKAEDGSRIGAASGLLTSSRLYTHAAVGGTLNQLLTDFGHTRNLVATERLRRRARDQAALATEQDVLLATDEAFYRLLDAQSLLGVARATVAARGTVEALAEALTRSALKSDLDLSLAASNLSEAQLGELDAENAVAAASATLAALLAAAPETVFEAREDEGAAPPPPPDPEAAGALAASAEAQRPDLQALRLDALAFGKLARAQELERLPAISALAAGGITPVGVDGVFVPHWYAAAAVNLAAPLFTGFRLEAEAEESRLRRRAAENQARDLANSIARDVEVAARNAETAFRRIGVAEQFSKEAAQALSLAQTRYKLGLSSMVELSQAQFASTQASVSAVNARYDYLLALRILDYAGGRLAP